MKKKLIIPIIIIAFICGLLIINNSFSLNEEETNTSNDKIQVSLQNIREVEEINEVEEKELKKSQAIPSINNNKIENISFSFHNPGDYLSFIFDIVNSDKDNIEISKININDIKCNGEYSEEELKKICDNISIDMIYESSNKEVKEGNTIFSNSKMPVNIMITYDNGPNTKEDVNVTIDNLTIEYEFKKSNY